MIKVNFTTGKATLENGKQRTLRISDKGVYFKTLLFKKVYLTANNCEII